MLRAAMAVKESHGGMGQLLAAHLNHGLRAEDSDTDAEWLENLCRSLGIPLEIGKSDVAAVAKCQGDGVEAAARAVRYDFLRQTAESHGARFVAVAHTADDQVETVLHRILRGTGIAGLRGIPSIRRLSNSVSLVRPLFAVRRCEVLQYLEAIGQDYRVDSSNADLRFTRNRLRHELLPALRAYYNADIDASLLRLAEQAAQTQQLISGIAAKLASDCVQFGGDSSRELRAGRRTHRIQIDCSLLKDQPQLIVRELCIAAWAEAGWPQQSMGFDQWQQLAELIAGENSHRAINLPGDILARRRASNLILEVGGLP
jgi:tRNA(Ile)-lysidine synthase